MLTACLRSFNPHPLRHSLKILDTELRAKNIFNSELDNFVTRSPGLKRAGNMVATLIGERSIKRGDQDSIKHDIQFGAAWPPHTSHWSLLSPIQIGSPAPGIERHFLNLVFLSYISNITNISMSFEKRL